MDRIKILRLNCRRCIRGFLKKLPFALSIIFLVFSAFVSFMILLPSAADKAPIYPYFIKKLEFPIVYELYGNIAIIDSDGNTNNSDITIFVGGYKEEIGSEEKYNISFSSPKNDSFYVNITYKDPSGDLKTFTESIKFSEDQHSIKKDFVIHVKDI